MLNQLRRWIDPRLKTVRVADVRAYLLGRGWSQGPSPRPHQLIFEERAGSSGAPGVLYVPSSEQFSDYSQRILEVVTELAEIEDRYAVDVLDDILRSSNSGGPNGVARERLAGSERKIESQQ